MSRVRPLEREDLPAVASLYELVIRSKTAQAPPGLASYIERLSCDQPFADPELPSLVYDEPGHGIVGFIASHARRFVFGDRSLRMACSGQLVAHPDFQSRGVGALLLRKYLAGPQDFTITDGATDGVRQIWERLGGVTHAMASVGWTRVLSPSRFAAAELARRRGRDAVRGARMWTALDGVAGRRLRPDRPATSSEPLSAAALLAGMSRLSRAFPMRPHYDTVFLTWLFREMEAVAPRGPLERRMVRDAGGDVVGWSVAYAPPAGVAQVVQVAGDDVGLVLDDLFQHAAERRAIAIQGRVDPYLYPLLAKRRCLFRPSAWALVHSRDPALVGAVTSGRALLTRLEGEWWMGHHRLDADALVRQARVHLPAA